MAARQAESGVATLHALVNRELLLHIYEVRHVVGRWRIDYNHLRRTTRWRTLARPLLQQNVSYLTETG